MRFVVALFGSEAQAIRADQCRADRPVHHRFQNSRVEKDETSITRWWLRGIASS